MRKRISKPKLRAEEEEEEVITPKTLLQVGDIMISSNKESLKSCKRTAEEMLKSKIIRHYLTGYSNKKKMLSLTGIG